MRKLGAMMPGTVMRDLTLTASHRAAGKTLRQLGLPGDALIVSIQRAGKTIIPRGDTQLAIGDQIVLVATAETATTAETILRG